MFSSALATPRSTAKRKDLKKLLKETLDVLSTGAAVALFSDGTSYTEPRIIRIKDGTSYAQPSCTRVLTLNGP